MMRSIAQLPLYPLHREIAQQEQICRIFLSHLSYSHTYSIYNTELLFIGVIYFTSKCVVCELVRNMYSVLFFVARWNSLWIMFTQRHNRSHNMTWLRYRSLRRWTLCWNTLYSENSLRRIDRWPQTDSFFRQMHSDGTRVTTPERR